MDLRRALVSALMSGLAGFAAAANAQTALVRIPGTTVTMAAPQGFRFAQKFAGLENAADGSRIQIVEFPPERYKDLAAAFSSPKSAAERFAADGLRITSIDTVTVDKIQVPLAIGGQETRTGRDLTTYVALLGGGATRTDTVLITFNIASGSPLRQSDVETLVRSVRLDRILTLDEKVASLPFTFKPVAPFRTVDVLGGSTALVATFEGQDPSGDKPILLIVSGPTGAAPSEVAQTAAKALRNMQGFSNADIKDQSPATFAGGPGNFIEAVANNRTMLQYMRVLPGGSYIRLAARGETKALEQLKQTVKQIAESVQLRE